ncbi:Oidioi.mRNA.OKI2018_I69.XSR.g16255.t1.cds [Oikopleura dioica]|uniref:Oidioi.mRNA.OKI2018_I69.PAR.g10456.t1.cds n=1 Tax=Oikopleura dioica TaxID=34765 RepID=A0ABN7SFH0_OIKDI|nr:Oidioi.mRNA.OKI2018_I69.PAR.g10456.t1.cds [Oikopleura dioica]CAG5084801.1 Oidioi.mRNA.OKI2018_I69.PAR.g10740.t1.cds [Oikopleura dioica]CAG5099105.1 Oidioi.mRNA.OKI2018_I69.XSR.g16255.t1.cds [Oikopleura dioica]
MRELDSERPLTPWERKIIDAIKNENLRSVSDLFILIKAEVEFNKDVELATQMMAKMKINNEGMEWEMTAKMDVDTENEEMEIDSVNKEMEVDSVDEEMECDGDQIDMMEE